MPFVRFNGMALSPLAIYVGRISYLRCLSGGTVARRVLSLSEVILLIGEIFLAVAPPSTNFPITIHIMANEAETILPALSMVHIEITTIFGMENQRH